MSRCVGLETMNLQYGLDGAPYISASIDYAHDATSGFACFGCGRLMSRGRRPAVLVLTPPRGWCALYHAAFPRAGPMPGPFAVGSHPADFLAAVAATAPMDELDVVGA